MEVEYYETNQQIPQFYWSLFKRHIFEVIANGNKKSFHYILAWMAHLAQKPGGQRPEHQ
jgi:hypothetical protein